MKYGFTVFVKTPTRSQFRTWLCVNHTHMGLEPKTFTEPPALPDWEASGIDLDPPV